uniref:Uncharacterized protein n=1 Tax=Acrobeloides nanus TaxID=290746 RepID=A0A914CT11_9BILA
MQLNIYKKAMIRIKIGSIDMRMDAYVVDDDLCPEAIILEWDTTIRISAEKHDVTLCDRDNAINIKRET